MLKKIFVGFLLVLVAAQFVRPEKNLSTGVSTNDITLKYAVPADVKTVLQRACYDCHSNQTHYPWYAEVQPIASWMDSHIKDGKRHLNFSEFGLYDTKRTTKKLAAIADEVEQHEMPLKSYTWIHAEARLTPSEIKSLADWTDTLSQEIVPSE
jgi:hypothetical protein